MTFIVDGAQWNFDGMAPVDITDAIEGFLDFIEKSFEKGEAVAIGDDFQSRVMLNARSLWELFGDDSGLNLPQELSQELAAWLGRVQFYTDTEDWPEGADNFVISIDDGPECENLDVAWVHQSILSGLTMSCASIFRSSISKVNSANGETKVHFVCDEGGRKVFWRCVILYEGDNEESMLRNAPRAYPDLYFHEGVLHDLRNLSGGYLAARERIRRTFEVLNDFGSWVFTFPPPAVGHNDAVPAQVGTRPSNQLIEDRFKGLGLIAAPEKPNVKSDPHCRKAREAKVKFSVLYCEWHVKIELHRNRVHLHSPVPESGNKVVVGMIADHLPLP